ncbi:MAG: phosphate acyltransferase PlsX [Candidatus Sulfobium sp.]
MRVALDAMGGDHAPSVNVEGAVETVNEHEDIEVTLVGNSELIKKELDNKRFPGGRILLLHASQVVELNESPAAALRTAPGVDRPAIAAIMPTIRDTFVLLDAGANVDCKPENLLEFALMGNTYCKLVLGRPEPKVALLSIGEEDTKGNELTKEAFKLIRKTKINFIGNIEGKDIFTGRADVVVCDGFIGNIALKISEGLAETVLRMLKREITSVSTGRVGYLLMKPAIRNFKKRTDYDEYGGAPLLGINGVSIISHGRSSAKAIRNALQVAADFAAKKVPEAISRDIEYNLGETGK